jgi:hypothetical protein
MPKSPNSSTENLSLSRLGWLDMRKAACIVHGAENNACVIQADKIN